MKPDSKTTAQRIRKANVLDIERVRREPAAKALVVDTYTALRRFMELCGVKP